MIDLMASSLKTAFMSSSPSKRRTIAGLSGDVVDIIDRKRSKGNGRSLIFRKTYWILPRGLYGLGEPRTKERIHFDGEEVAIFSTEYQHVHSHVRLHKIRRLVDLQRAPAHNIELLV